MDILIDLIIITLVAAVVIWIVGKLGLGMTVDSYGSAITAAIVIAIVTAVLIWLLDLIGISFGGVLLGPILTLIVAAVVLLLADRFLSGLQVKGFVGAIVAAIAIGVVSWLLGWLLVTLGIAI
jgi:putative membrane protein